MGGRPHRINGRDWLAAIPLCLLVLGWSWPESKWVLMLSTSSALAAELDQTGTRGYYEDLLDEGRRSTSQHLKARPGDEPHEITPPIGWVAFADSGIVEEVPGFVRWRMRPNLDLTWNDARFRTNSLGYRSPEIERSKPPGTYRIALLGSSNTMGHGVSDDAVYARDLERWLNLKVGAEGPRVEVVNMAVSGDAPSQRLWRLSEAVAALEPDWVLCDATVLDVSLEEVHLESIVSRGVPIPFDYVRQALREAGITTVEDPQAFRRAVRTVAVPLLDGAFAGWAEVSERLGLPLTVLILPRADKKTENPRLGELLRTLADQYELDYVDVTHAFDGLEVEQFRVSPWDHHPSVLGHRRIFETLRDALKERGGGLGLVFPAHEPE